MLYIISFINGTIVDKSAQQYNTSTNNTSDFHDQEKCILLKIGQFLSNVCLNYLHKTLIDLRLLM